MQYILVFCVSMIKKVITLILSLIVLVYLIFYGNIFEFELNKFQMSVFKDSVIIYLFLTGSCFLVGEISRNSFTNFKAWLYFLAFIRISTLEVFKNKFFVPCSGPLTSEPAIGWLEVHEIPFFNFCLIILFKFLYTLPPY